MPTLAARLPNNKNFAFIRVRLAEGADLKVEGYGMPYKNPGDPEVEGWANNNAPITESWT
jgi:hypothetical protein